MLYIALIGIGAVIVAMIYSIEVVNREGVSCLMD